MWSRSACSSSQGRARPRLDTKLPAGTVIFLALLVLSVGFAARGILFCHQRPTVLDVAPSGSPPLAAGAFALLGLALLIALAMRGTDRGAWPRASWLYRLQRRLALKGRPE